MKSDKEQIRQLALTLLRMFHEQLSVVWNVAQEQDILRRVVFREPNTDERWTEEARKPLESASVAQLHMVLVRMGALIRALDSGAWERLDDFLKTN